jgi:exodeoxyribonuclease VII large subunit
MNDVILGVTDFVAVFNQTLEYAYPSVTIVGELSNLRVSKGRWVYFDLKDDYSSVKFFGTIQQLSGPLEDGMMLQVRGVPRLHNVFGFSVNVQFITPVGEGSLKKAASLLEAQLKKEGLFDDSRKRAVPFAPQKIGLITSGESAAYTDFIKILNARWGGVEILLADVQVQGEPAVGQISRAIDYFNEHEQVDVLVITRGGGSADDLAVFSTEQVVRAVAASRTPTLVAIGHEIDISLAELVADKRASTPSNAAELLVPDKSSEKEIINRMAYQSSLVVLQNLNNQKQYNSVTLSDISQEIERLFLKNRHELQSFKTIARALSPAAVLARGYAIVRDINGDVIGSRKMTVGQEIKLELQTQSVRATILEAEQKGR